MTTMPDRVIRTLDGKRGAFLLVGGLAYAFIGLSYVVAPTAGRQAAFSWLPDPLTPQLLGWVWVVGGVGVAVVSLISRAHRATEPPAFGVLMLCPALWVVIFAVSSIVGVHPSGWVSSIAYGLMSMWVWIAAGWDNPTPRGRTVRGE